MISNYTQLVLIFRFNFNVIWNQKLELKLDYTSQSNWCKLKIQIFILSIFYFKYLNCEIRSSKPKKLCSKAYKIGLSLTKILCWYSVFGWLHFKWYKIFIYEGWSLHKVWMGNFNENKKVETILSVIKQWLTSYFKPKMLHTDNGGEFRNKVMKII